MDKQNETPEPTGYELLLLNRAGFSTRNLAKRYDLTLGQVARRIADAKKQFSKEAQAFDRVHLGTPFALRGDAIVVGDVHVPTTDYTFSKLIGAVAMKHLQAPRRLIIAGDFFNMDSFSIYSPVVSPPSWGDELKAARILLGEWFQVFDEVNVIFGNHDRRLQKWTTAEFGPEDIFAMVTTNEKLKVSNYGWCTIDTPSGLWRITHAKNYSINQLTVADQLALKFDCHIISHHEHHLAMGYDRYKRHIIVNNGGLFDVSQMAYVVLDDNKAARMAQGFTMLRNGVPHLFGNYPFTDYSMWL